MIHRVNITREEAHRKSQHPTVEEEININSGPLENATQGPVCNDGHFFRNKNLHNENLGGNRKNEDFCWVGLNLSQNSTSFSKQNKLKYKRKVQMKIHVFPSHIQVVSFQILIFVSFEA